MDNVVEYVYDIDGLRVSKTVGGTKRTDYVFDLSGKILEEAGAEESVQYVFLKERHLARVEKGEVLFYGTDHLSSTILMTDSKGIPVWTADVSPFGDFTVVSSDSYSSLGLKFTGKDADESTGLYYFNARWYDSDTGRFITEDPIRDGENWYAYCSNNPVMWVDPSGLALETAWDIASLAMGVASFVGNVKEGNVGSAVFDAVGIVADAAAVVTPFVPGGVGAAIKGARAFNKVDDVVDLLQVADKVDDITDTAKALNNLDSAGDTVRALDKAGDANKGKKYVTYTKKNPNTGEIYSGRTSGTGSADDIISNRDRKHHMKDKGFGPAIPDKVSTNPDAIRGREQQLIEAHGGAKSRQGTSGNAINGISESNPKRVDYINAAKKEFGN